MITKVLITGDIHGAVERRLNYVQSAFSALDPTQTAIIMLGDVGLNYYKSKRDWKTKHWISRFGYTLYCLRGNHEDRPSNCKNMEKIYDEFVHGYVWVEKEFPLIRYFEDKVAEYEIMGKSVLCIPGAYSVDKWYRLKNDWIWFADEQLTAEEMTEAEQVYSGKYYDFVFSHTAPVTWEPYDLFLGFIDQSTVDKSMEVWMDKFKDMIGWGCWCFGHFHADRLERPYVEQFYYEVEELGTVFERWQKYCKTGELSWWLPKSPNFYMDIPKEES